MRYSSTNRRWLRIAAAACLALALLLLGVRSGGIRGWLAPIRVSGGSMAPALLGEHRQRICEDCRFPFVCDAAAYTDNSRVVCPNCGCLQSESGDATVSRGQRLLLDTWAFSARSPRRWEVVAFPAPDEPSRLLVKRVIGLPGEIIAIREGQLYVNDRLQRKSLDELRRMAVLVHDHRYAPTRTAGLPSRWLPVANARGWSTAADAFHYRPTQLAIAHGIVTGQIPPSPLPLQEWNGSLENHRYDPLLSRLEWLEYENWRCCANPLPRSEPCQVLDHLGYNQGLSRNLNPVGDLLLACRFATPGDAGSVAFRLHDGHRWWIVVCDFGSLSAKLFLNDQPVASRRLPPVAYARGVHAAVATCDAQLLMAIEDQTVFRWICEPPDGAADFQPRPVAIGAAGNSVRVDRLQVWRDLHYLDPQGLPRPWSTPGPLAADRFFLIGDNLPISRDSRHEQPAGVPREQLIGRVLH